MPPRAARSYLIETMTLFGDPAMRLPSLPRHSSRSTCLRCCGKIEGQTDNGFVGVNIMNKHTSIDRRRKTMLSATLALLMICGLLIAFAPDATAAVRLLYFTATPGSDTILLEWETATEQDYRRVQSLSLARQWLQRASRSATRFLSKAGRLSAGAKYSYTDNDVATGVRYYYSLEEIATSWRSSQSSLRLMPASTCRR